MPRLEDDQWFSRNSKIPSGTGQVFELPHVKTGLGWARFLPESMIHANRIIFSSLVNFFYDYPVHRNTYSMLKYQQVLVRQ